MCPEYCMRSPCFTDLAVILLGVAACMKATWSLYNIHFNNANVCLLLKNATSLTGLNNSTPHHTALTVLVRPWIASEALKCHGNNLLSGAARCPPFRGLNYRYINVAVFIIIIISIHNNMSPSQWISGFQQKNRCHFNDKKDTLLSSLAADSDSGKSTSSSWPLRVIIMAN